MRKWKSRAALVLSVSFALSGAFGANAASPEFARTPEEWAVLRDNVMEYGELVGLIHEYNVTVQKNQLDLKDKKQDGRITSDQNAQYYRDAACDYRSAISGQNTIMDAHNAVGAVNADAQADRNTEDLTVYQLSYLFEEANLVAQAQSSMIAYFRLNCEIENAENNLKLSESLYRSALTRQGAGMATQADVLAVLEQVEALKVSLEKARSERETIRQSLCVMLGWKYNDLPEIREIPALDLARIEAMNPETDKEKALSANYTLQTNKKKLENATADITKETLARTIQSNEQSIGSDLVKSYQEVQKAKASEALARQEYNLESKNAQAAELKFKLGTISRLEHESQQNALKAKEIGWKLSELSLFQAVQSYENGVNGLAAAGA